MRPSTLFTIRKLTEWAAEVENYTSATTTVYSVSKNIKFLHKHNNGSCIYSQGKSDDDYEYELHCNRELIAAPKQVIHFMR